MEVVLLAGGKGSRMKGEKTKVLVEVDGIPIIKRIVNNLNNKYINRIIVVAGEFIEEISKVLNGNITYAYQKEPLGTMDAYIQALPYVSTKQVLVLPSDIPYLDKNMIQEIIVMQ